MLRELSAEAEITFLSLAPYSNVSGYFADYDEGLQEIERALGQFCKDVVLVPHGKFNRQKTKLINAAKSLFSALPYDVIWLKSGLFAREITRVYNAEEYDLVHVDTIGLWPYVADLQNHIVLNHHNIESHLLARRSSLSSWPISRYFKSQVKKLKEIERKAGNEVALNVCCSEVDEIRLQSIGIAKTATVANGVDLSYFSRSAAYSASCSPRLVFAGGLGWYPNRDAMIFFAKHVWPLLICDNDQIEMSVIGKGKVSLLTELSNRDDRFHVTGFVDDVRPYLEQASVYVCPIFDGGGTKLKVLDALAMGVPLVSHPVACEGIDVREGVDVLFAETPAEFSATILRLLGDPGLRLALARNGRALIEEKYSYKKIGANLIQLYKGCASS